MPPCCSAPFPTVATGSWTPCLRPPHCGSASASPDPWASRSQASSGGWIPKRPSSKVRPHAASRSSSPSSSTPCAPPRGAWARLSGKRSNAVPRRWSWVWAARPRWTAAPARRAAWAGSSSTPQERRSPKAAARWRSWRSSTGGGVSPPGSSRLPTSPRRSSARGAAPVFGPQKGAEPEGVKLLSRGLERLAELMARHGWGDLATLPGGGAAGGLGAGLVCFAKAELTSGADWVLERVGFDAALAKAQLVITGEGTFDKTALVGKASGEVVRRAQAAKTRVAVVAGKVEGLVGLHALDGEGRVLDAAGISALAERAVREAFGLPAA